MYELLAKPLAWLSCLNPGEGVTGQRVFQSQQRGLSTVMDGPRKVITKCQSGVDGPLLKSGLYQHFWAP